MKNRALIFTLTLLLIFTMTACNKESAHDPNRVLVLVNGEEILQAEFDEKYTKNLEYFETIETPITSELEVQLKNDVLNSMIRDLLLKQYAMKDDYEPSEDDVETVYQQYVTQYETEEQLKSELQEKDISLEEFRNDLKQQIDIDNYLNQYVIDNNLYADTIVTDQEVQDYFLQYVLQTGQKDLKISDVEAQIKASIGQEKMRQLLTKITDNLMTESTIENKVEFK